MFSGSFWIIGVQIEEMLLSACLNPHGVCILWALFVCSQQLKSAKVDDETNCPPPPTG